MKKLLKKIIKSVIHKTGFNISRYHPGNDKFAWLKNYNVRTVIDIGANTGQFASEIRTCLPKAKIISFEPVSECFEQLNKNMTNDKNFQSFNIPLGEREYLTEINVSSYTPSSSLLKMAELHEQIFPHTKGGGTPQKVTVKTLDSFWGQISCPKDILIKMDVQGYEDRVILGGNRFLSEAKIVLAETSFSELYKGQLLFDRIYDMLNKLGFSYFGNTGQKKNPQTGELLFEDSIFIKKQI